MATQTQQQHHHHQQEAEGEEEEEIKVRTSMNSVKDKNNNDTQSQSHRNNEQTPLKIDRKNLSEDAVEKIRERLFPNIPRVEVDPTSGKKQFNSFQVLRYMITRVIRGSLLATLFTWFLAEPVRKFVVTYLQQKGLSERTIFTILPCVSHGTVFFGLVAVYGLISWSKKFERYRIPQRDSAIPSSSLLTRAAMEEGFSHIVVFPFAYYFGFWYLMHDVRQIPSMLESVQASASLPKIFMQFVVALLVNDLGFYSFHRLLHHPLLYSKFHKQHHTFIATVPLATEFAGPLEVLLSNALPNFLGCLLLRAHPLVFLVWIDWSLMESIEAHSGFTFPGTFLHKLGLTHSESSLFHAFHHNVNKGVFGTGLLYLDHFGGTLKTWLDKFHYVGELPEEILNEQLQQVKAE